MSAGDDVARIDRAATLIVTRPEPEAGKLVDALIARGRRAWALPVLAIEKLQDASDDESTLRRAMSRIDAHGDDYRLVVFVSPNAIRHALATRERAWPKTVVIGVMGPGSVETLRTMGIASPAHRVLSPRDGSADADAGDTERFDSEGLFAALDDALGLTKDFDGRVLIVRGNGGRAWFAERLRSLGIEVDEVVAYRRVRPVANPEQASALRDAFDQPVKPVFVVTSSEGVANLMTIAQEALVGVMTLDSIQDRMFASTIVAPHRRIAARAREAGFRHVVVTSSGDHGILAAIE